MEKVESKSLDLDGVAACVFALQYTCSDCRPFHARDPLIGSVSFRAVG